MWFRRVVRRGLLVFVLGALLVHETVQRNLEIDDFQRVPLLAFSEPWLHRIWIPARDYRKNHPTFAGGVETQWQMP